MTLVLPYYIRFRVLYGLELEMAKEKVAHMPVVQKYLFEALI